MPQALNVADRQVRMLEGLRFADFTWAGAGAYTTKFFADLGADIIKIESETRLDPVRTGGPFKDGVAGVNRSGYFASRNTGKRSLSLNMKTQKAREVARRLIETADVVSNNFGPGIMEKWGLAYEDVVLIKPDVIYLSMPMYGEEGPFRNYLGVGKTISAVTGLHYVTGAGDETPVGPGTHFPDHAANPYHGAFAILSALLYRDATGEGQKIELAQVESTANVVGHLMVQASITGQEPPRIGNTALHACPYGVYRCDGDDVWCAISVETESSWKALASVMAEPQWLVDPSYHRVSFRLARRSEIDAAVQAWTSVRSQSDVISILSAQGVPCAPVATIATLVEEDVHLRERKHWVHLDHPEMGPTLLNAPPFRFGSPDAVQLRRSPLLGEHTDEILKELGYTPEEIEEMRHNQVLT